MNEVCQLSQSVNDCQVFDVERGRDRLVEIIEVVQVLPIVASHHNQRLPYHYCRMSTPC